MPKKIILLSDGTGNSSHDPFKTNVWRLYQALDLNRLEDQTPNKDDKNLPDQVAYYDDGVGTESTQWLALPGLAFGYGLKRNVLDLYTFLCRNYEEGAEIYCFGFSRGAFTVRVLAALICTQGLVATGNVKEADRQRLARAAFRSYRQRSFSHGNPWNLFRWLGVFVQLLRDLFIVGWNWVWRHPQYLEPPDPTVNECAWLARFVKGKKKWLNQLRRSLGNCVESKTGIPVTFLGVWDTVAAYGLPIDELTRAWDVVFPISFPNSELHPDIKRACHALALDDERHSFYPELWTEVNQDKTKVSPDRLLQVWFAGMHSDVGGSYPDDAMSYVPLEWMIKQAENQGQGLRFKQADKAVIKAAANLRGPLHDSRSGVGGFYRYRPRKLADLIDDNSDKRAPVKIEHPKIHESVFERIENGTDSYAPIVLPEEFAVYRRTGEVLWLDRNGQYHTPSGPCAPPVLPLPVICQPGFKLRHLLQEHLWDLVWKKRVVYFLTVAAALVIAAFPLIFTADAACQGPFCAAAPLARALAFVLPGFVAPWLKAYESHPVWFLLALGVYAVLYGQGRRLQQRIFDGMHLKSGHIL
jgi:uncharacterized protein (DUF2235 family)